MQMMNKNGFNRCAEFYIGRLQMCIRDRDYYVVKFTVPEKFVGYFVNELNLNEEFHLKMIGLKRANKIINSLGISLTELHVKNELPGNEKVEEGDELVCYGRYRDFQAFWKAI